MPPLVFIAYFRMHMPTHDAWRAVAGAWTTLATPIAKNIFYLRSMGLDDTVGNAGRMLLVFAGFLAFIAAAVAFSWNDPQGMSRPRQILQRLARPALLGIVIFLAPWTALPRAFPLITLAALGAFGILFLRRRSNRDSAIQLLPLLMWSAFSLALLAKIWLNTRIVHYGFCLAPPATTVVIVSVFSRSWLLSTRGRQLGLRSASGS